MALTKKIEDYRPGYPRYTALLSSYNSYFLCRGFGKLRGRLLLIKQDRLSVLEEKLELLDQEEKCPLFLGKSRSDKNTERLAILSEIEACLADYDNFAEGTNRMLNFGQAQPRDIESLQNWLSGTGCLAREERAYLSYRDLISLAPTGDNATVKLETWVEDKLIRLYRSFRKGPYHDLSVDPNVYIYSGPWIKRIAKAILLLLISLLLLMPVVFCNMVTTTAGRTAIVVLSTISYLIIISGLTQSRSMELVVAGATYATILTVFVTTTSAS